MGVGVRKRAGSEAGKETSNHKVKTPGAKRGKRFTCESKEDQYGEIGDDDRGEDDVTSI